MKGYLKLNSLLFSIILLSSCSSPYKKLVTTTSSISAYKYEPELDKALYRCIIDGRFILKKFHLSGLLFFKELENGTKRAVYQNELGITFFDFAWNIEDSFSVKQVIPQLDKEAVINTLKKDIEMLLLIGLEKNSEKTFIDSRGIEQFNRLSISNGYVYYVTKDEKLVRIENANNRKRIVTVNVGAKAETSAMPQDVLIEHHTANFTISLKKIETDATK